MNLGPEAWVERRIPLAPAGVVGLGAVAGALARRVLEGAPEGLLAAGGPGMLLLAGPATALPWADGAIWLGRDAVAPRLLLPTTHAPPVHPALIEARLGVVAVILEPPRFVPLSGLGPLDPDVLRRWLEAA